MTRSAGRKRRVVIITDGAKFHTPAGSKRVRQLLEHYGRRLKLQYLPGYSPECMPMELFWNDWRDQVTHHHDRIEFKRLELDSDNYLARCARAPQKVLRTLRSPFASRQNRKT